MNREQELNNRTSERFLFEQKQKDAYLNDPTYHAQIKIINMFMAEADRAMRAEMIPIGVRDRVISRLLWGEPHSPSDLRAEYSRMADMQTVFERVKERTRKWGYL